MSLRRDPLKPSPDKKSADAAQVKLIEAAGQVLLDQGWIVLVAGGLKIVRHNEEPSGVHWLCMKFTGAKRHGVKADDSAVRLLSKPDRSDGGKLRKKNPASRGVGKARKTR